MKTLELAHWLERDGANCQQHLDAAAELRRLYDDNENTLKHFNETVEAYKMMATQRDALFVVLKEIVALWDHHCYAHGDGVPSPLHVKARAAIAAATGEVQA